MSHEIFYRRLRYELGEKLRTARSVIDWTIALYFIIPACIFGGMYYRSLWEDIPDWPSFLFGSSLQQIPELTDILTLLVLLGVLYTVTYSRSVRSFLEEADSLFLLQSPSIIRSIVTKGLVYSFLRATITNIVCLILLLPFFMKQLQFTVLDMWLLFVYFTSIRMINLCLNRYRLLAFKRRWQEWLAAVTFYNVGFGLFFFGVQSMLSNYFLLLPYMLLSLLILFLCIRNRLQVKHYFLQEVACERAELLRWTSAIMMGAGHTPKSSERKQPRLFPKSKPIWKGKTAGEQVIEAFLKDYIRTGSNRQFYIMVTIYSSGVFFVAPLWLSGLVCAFALFALFQHGGEHWGAFADKPLLRMYCSTGELLLLKESARIRLLLPAVVWYGIIGLALVSLWLGAVIFICLAIFVGYYVFTPGKA